MMDIKVLVIIVTYNGAEWINRCLDSIKLSHTPATIFIVDNHSTDNTVSLIKAGYPEVVLHESDKNLGFGGANNMGFVYAAKNGYDYIYLLNQDAWLMPNTIDVLVNVNKLHPEYGIVSPLQVNANMNALDQRFAIFISQNPKIVSDYAFESVKDVYDANFVMAAHWLISRDCFLKAGLFSPIFYHYGEDDNYLHRVKYFGYKVGVAPLTMAVHDREYRELTKEKAKLFITVRFLVEASNINYPFFYAICRAYIISIASSFYKAKKYKDFRIIFKFIPLILEIGKIHQERKNVKKYAFDTELSENV